MKTTTNLGSMFKTDKFSYILLLCLTISIGCFDDIKEPETLIFLITLSFINHNLYKGEPIYFKFLKGLFYAGLYYLQISTNNNTISQSIYSFLVLNLIFLGIKYFNSKNTPTLTNYFFQAFKCVFIATIIAVIFFLAGFFLIFFFTLLFTDETINYYNWLSGLSLSLCLLIISKFNYNPDSNVGNLYKYLFNLTIPLLTVFTGVLAIIYFLQSYFGYKEILTFTTQYYPFVITYYGFYILSCNQPSSKLRRTNLSIFVMISFIAIIYLITRQVNYPDNQLGYIYGILCNAIFMLYNLYLLIKKQAINKSFWSLVMILSLIVFCPLLGYFNYVAISQKSPNNAYNLTYALSLEDRNISYPDANTAKTYSFAQDPSIIPLPPNSKKIYLNRLLSKHQPTINLDQDNLKLELIGKKITINYQGNTSTVEVPLVENESATDYLKLKFNGGTLYIYYLTYNDVANSEITAIDFHIILDH